MVSSPDEKQSMQVCNDRYIFMKGNSSDDEWYSASSEVSPTPSLLCDDDSDSGSSLSSQDSSDSLSSRVSWASDIIQDVHYRPKLTNLEKNQQFYSGSDYQQFRHSYKCQLFKAAKARKVQEAEEQEEQASRREQSRQETTPLSWLVNSLHSYLSRRAPEGCEERSQERNMNRTSIGKELHIELLVDTLYLF